MKEEIVALSPEEVARIAALACIDLTEDEKTQFAEQIDLILTSITQVSQAPIADVPPMSHAMPLVNVVRDDVVRPSLPVADVLAGAPSAELDRFRVPQILGEAG